MLRKIKYPGALGSPPHQVNLVASHATNLESLGINRPVAPFPIDHGVDFRLIFPENRHVDRPFSNEDLLGHLEHPHFSILREGDYVIQCGTFLDRFLLLQAVARKAIFLVQVEHFTRHHDRRPLHRAKFRDLGFPLATFAILLFEHLEILHRVTRDVADILLGLLDPILQAPNFLVGPETVVFGNPLNANFRQTNNIVPGHFSLQQFFERIQALVNRLDHRFPSLTFLDVPVDSVLDKNFLKRTEMPLVIELSQQDLELQQEQLFSHASAIFKNLTDRHEDRPPVVNNTRVGRNTHLAITEGIQRFTCRLSIAACRQMHQNLNIFGGIILDPRDLDLPLVVGIDDGIHHPAGRCPKRNRANPKQLGFHDLNLRTHPDFSSPKSVTIVADINQSTGRKIGHEIKGFLSQDRDAGVDQLDEIMRQNLTRQSHRNSLHTLRKEQRKLHR